MTMKKAQSNKRFWLDDLHSIGLLSNIFRRNKEGPSAKTTGGSSAASWTNIHAATDNQGRPIAFLLTPGNASDIKAAKPLLEPLQASRQLLGDTAYDSDDLRASLNTRQTEAVIPNKNNRMTPLSIQETPLSPAQ